ncbi:MAG: response regulator [Phycisphaerae bacterium]
MLLIERYNESAIQIGNNIKVKVLKTGQNRVLLGIDAPRAIPVVREELLAKSPPRTGPIPQKADFRILAVEDDPDHVDLIRLALSETSTADLTVAPTGEEAMRILGRNGSEGAFKPDLVLLDLRLPGMSGLDVLRLIRSVPALRPTPVVMLSCSQDDGDVRRSIDEGANAFVSKSSSFSAFNESIQRIAEFWQHARSVA